MQIKPEYQAIPSQSSVTMDQTCIMNSNGIIATLSATALHHVEEISQLVVKPLKCLSSGAVVAVLSKYDCRSITYSQLGSTEFE